MNKKIKIVNNNFGDNMFDEILNEIYIKRQEIVEKNIHEEYHKRLKNIEDKNEDERHNIKLGIISELYYKEGFKDGINFIITSMKNRIKN